MAKFEVVSKYADAGLTLPVRKTAQSAGYDFVVAEDTVIPSWTSRMSDINEYLYARELCGDNIDPPFTLDEMKMVTGATKCKPTLVSTGMKCKLDPGTYLELSVRSSSPLKYWIVMANSVGIIDADYYNNPDNEGEIFFQLINLSPVDIILQKGEAIGQGIIHTFGLTEDDNAVGERMGGFGSTSV